MHGLLGHPKLLRPVHSFSVRTHQRWPCCTPQDKVVLPGRDYSTQKVILGTHTSEGEQNHLMIAEVELPLEDSELDNR